MAHQVVLAALDEEDATIRLAGQNYRVPVGEITALWYGEYLLLWRPQIGAVKSFYPGMRDPDVAWLRESLATIQGTPDRSDQCNRGRFIRRSSGSKRARLSDRAPLERRWPRRSANADPD